MYVIVQHINSDRWCIVSEFGHTVSSSLTFASAVNWLIFHYSQVAYQVQTESGPAH